MFLPVSFFLCCLLFTKSLFLFRYAISTDGSRMEQECDQRKELPRREMVLERVGCIAKMDVGDVLFFIGNMYHRTQDSVVHRVALQADWSGSAGKLTHNHNSTGRDSCSLIKPHGNVTGLLR